LADFGTAMKDAPPEATKDIFVGTAQFVSPEILNEEGEAITQAADLWAVGCILYQLLCGWTPFKADTEYLIFVAITGHLDGTQPILYPPSVSVSPVAVNMIEGLLKKDPLERYGAGPAGSENSYQALKLHDFFVGIDFDNLLNMTPPEWNEYRNAYLNRPSSSSTSSNGSVQGEVMHDGALDDWLFEGDATPIVNDVRVSAVTQFNAQQGRRISSVVSKYQKYLAIGERDVFAGLVFKRVVRVTRIMCVHLYCSDLFLFDS
jgi:serine/threonine protein kinase